MFHNANGLDQSCPACDMWRQHEGFLLPPASNTSIQNALVDLLGKPIADSNALCIPTATHANPGGAAQAWNFIAAHRQLA